jgi:hypothetical protein
LILALAARDRSDLIMAVESLHEQYPHLVIVRPR